MTTTIHLPTLSTLLTWARKKSPDARVGHTSTETECPIATYLSSVYPGRTWFVNGETISSTNEEDGVRETPVLLRIVIEEVDFPFTPKIVKAGELVDILLKVEREHGKETTK